MIAKMNRREFITLLGGTAAAWPLAARAQQPKVYRIGALVVGNADVHSLRTELREALRKSGYVEGQNLLFEFRSAEEQLDRLPRLATELVALKVDVIVAIYTPCALAAQRATREIPIVIVSGNPIETGLVPSLSRPGGNITGISLIAAELHASVLSSSATCFHPYAASLRLGALLIRSRNSSLNKFSLRAELPTSKSRPPYWCTGPVRSMRHSQR